GRRDEDRQTVARRTRKEPEGTGTATRNGPAALFGGERRRIGRSVDTDSKTEQAQAVAENPAAAKVEGKVEQQPEQPQQPRPAPAPETKVDLATLKEMSTQELTKVAKQLDVPGATGMRKQELIFQILRCRAEKSGNLFSEGVLET